ncbi:hypothetical protein pETSU_097 [Edwardsiella phage pEt-SU]|uniref:Uncharacterized protein n=1 Tax=Edwardsiella phage pEt-SU TaxID=2562142 RepID=A0A4D6DWS7_9CAUD|nr:hypothetical protein HOV39_gp097 [Edwardsiella phage pEt-SU]QBZ70678.1 hypothetical protein pETSU_097 [Edwardsiella phage pEt-SU]
MQLVVSATPGTGKSTITKNAEKYGLNHCHVHYDNHTREYELTVPNSPLVPVFDSDSSTFDKSEFPGNYIKHIKEVLAKFPDVVIFVSSHDNVREAMAEAGINYVLAYPERELKGDYLERYKERGSPEKFIALMDEKWNDFIDSVQADKAERHLVLSEGEFLVDVLKSDLEAIGSQVDSVFPTAIISGTESIGDVVCDDVGQPVAVWGSNGLEPLPSTEPVADVVVVTDPLAVATPEPTTVIPKDSDPAAVVPQQDFSTAIITGNESIGETVYDDIGTPVAIVGEVGLEPLPVTEIVPIEVIVDVNAEPVEEPPAAMDPQDTPIPVTSMPEQMQAPDPVPPVSGQPAVDAPEVQAPAEEVVVVVDPGAGTVQVDGQEDNDLPVPENNIPPALQDMDKAELIENYHELNDDVTVLEAVIDVCQTDDRGGLEGYEDNGPVFTKAVEHLKERYGATVEPTLAGLESFLEELKKVGTAVKRAFSDPKAAQAKVKNALWELSKAKDEYKSPAWQNKQDWINVGKIRVDVPSFLKEANSPEEVGTALKLVIKRIVDASEKHGKNDIARHKAAIKVFNATKGWDPKEKTAADAKELLDSIPEPLGDAVGDAGLNELNTKLVSVELPAIPKTNVVKVVELMDMLSQASSDMFKHEDAIPEHLGWEQYSKNKFLTDINASKVYNIISSEADEPACSVISSAYYKQFLNVAKFLEMWILRSTK